MKKLIIITLIVVAAVTLCDSKRLSKSRSSSRGSSQKSYKPSPTSHSQPSVPQPQPKPSLFGWQEKPVQRTQTSQARQSKPSNQQTHSYPSSQNGMSGSGTNTAPKQPQINQDNIQRSNVPQSYSGQARSPSQPSQTNQAGHSYPASNGMSGNPAQGAGYPQGSGLSGAGTGSAGAPSSYNAGNYPNNNYGNQRQGPPPAYSNANGYPHGGAPPPYSPGNHQSNNYGNNYHHPQGPPPPYSNGFGGYGGHHGGYNPSYTPQMPGYFGNYGNNRGFGSVGRSGSALTGVGIAGAGVGTLLTGLALWNLARSTGRSHHTVIYDNRGQPVAVAPANGTEAAADSILGDLENCTLTISNDNSTEVLAIPCAIATSFSPDVDVKDASSSKNPNDNTKCTVTVITKAGKEYMTTIPCSLLLNTAAENNVTEPPLIDSGTDIMNNGTMATLNDNPVHNAPISQSYSNTNESSNKSLNCTLEPGDARDPINPCFAVTQNLTVIPLLQNNDTVILSTPSSA